MRQLGICALLLLLCACDGGRAPSAPSARLATGTWAGAITTDAGAEGTMTLVLIQDESGAIAGTATITLPMFALVGGVVSGAVAPRATAPAPTGRSISVGGLCPATLAAPAVFLTPTALDGTIAGGDRSCALDLSGRFALRKS
jgi:hypothetical protein